MKVIMLAGDNKGAIMELNPPQKTHYSAGESQSLHKNISKETLVTRKI